MIGTGMSPSAKSSRAIEFEDESGIDTARRSAYTVVAQCPEDCCSNEPRWRRGRCCAMSGLAVTAFVAAAGYAAYAGVIPGLRGFGPFEAGAEGSSTAAASPRPQSVSKGCCHAAAKAECLACKVGQSVEEYCRSRAHDNVTGCAGACGLSEDGYDYPGGDLRLVKNVTSADHCCSLCRREPNCSSWTWGKASAGISASICYLKDQVEFRRKPNKALVSGLPGLDAATFEINSRDGVCLDVVGDQVRMEACASSSEESHRWSYDRSTGQLRHENGTKRTCVDASRASKKGGDLRARSCLTGAASQQWVYWESTGLIMNKQGVCLDAPERQKSGSRVVTKPCHTQSPSQRWRIWNPKKAEARAAAKEARAKAAKEARAKAAEAKRKAEEKAEKKAEQEAARKAEKAKEAAAKAAKAAEKRLTAELADLPKVEANSLYCFSLVTPWSKEPELVEWQRARQKSIFACNASAIYSNPQIKVGGVETNAVPIDLHCPLGGRFHTAMNTPIFEKLWEQVIVDGKFRHYAWSVKVDPDAVFVPQKLRVIVGGPEYAAAQTGRGQLLVNCKFGLRGPVEVLSRQALVVWGQMHKGCAKPPQEDIYLQSCLVSLGVTKVDSFDVVADQFCDAADWTPCTSGQRAAFHPYKTLDAYRRCVSHIEGSQKKRLRPAAAASVTA
mmetsp:Transcript_51790/g.110797  ORF Transcript_51790/g.110797 Transcript_51790/m.110797 type:complete len:671 (-) Transcript_51790:74-2086(-)